MIARLKDGPPEVMKTADVARYLQVSPRKAQYWVRTLLAYGLEPLAAGRGFRCFRDNLIDALKAEAAEAVRNG